MLAKLLKYDFKNLGTTIIPMYVCLAIFAVLDRVVHFLQKTEAFSNIKEVEYIANFTQVFLMIGLFCLFIMVLVIGINYYKDNIMRDQGYLMHTLPVSAYHLVTSKILSFLCYIVFSAIVCYFILAIDFGNICWYRKVYNDVFAFISTSKAVFLCVNMGVYSFIYLAFCILLGYLSINIGFTVSGKIRPVAIVAVIMLFMIIGKCGELLMVYFLSRAGYTNMDLATVPMEVLQTLFVSLGSLYVVLSVLCYVLSVRWLGNHLNLD